MIHLPIHASWLNQIEIYFSILQRKALTPNDFADLDALAARIHGFEDHYRQIAKPFEWTFTRADLNAPARPPRQPRAAPAPGRLSLRRQQHAARRALHTGTHRDRLDHARAQQLPRPARQIDQRDRRQASGCNRPASRSTITARASRARSTGVSSSSSTSSNTASPASSSSSAIASHNRPNAGESNFGSSTCNDRSRHGKSTNSSSKTANSRSLNAPAESETSRAAPLKTPPPSSPAKARASRRSTA